MAIEIEAKMLGIVPEEIEEKLRALGAVKRGDFFFRSTVFDFPGFPLDKELSWLRLRDEGERVMLAFKHRLGARADDGTANDEGMEEIETQVGDFDSMKAILSKIGMVEKFSQEKKRSEWKKGMITFDLDTWPRLAPYLEVEGPSWEDVDAAIVSLGLDPAAKKVCSTTQIYEMNGIRDKDYMRMAFDGFIKR